jgi:hypothetical protein
MTLKRYEKKIIFVYPNANKPKLLLRLLKKIWWFTIGNWLIPPIDDSGMILCIALHAFDISLLQPFQKRQEKAAYTSMQVIFLYSLYFLIAEH